MTEKDINNIIRDTAYQVAQAIKSENSGFAPELKQQLKDVKRQLDAQDVAHNQQASVIEELKNTINSWKWGAKVSFWGLTAIGAVTTWVLSILGVHIGIK